MSSSASVNGALILDLGSHIDLPAQPASFVAFIGTLVEDIGEPEVIEALSASVSGSAIVGRFSYGSLISQRASLSASISHVWSGNPGSGKSWTKQTGNSKTWTPQPQGNKTWN